MLGFLRWRLIACCSVAASGAGALPTVAVHPARGEGPVGAASQPSARCRLEIEEGESIGLLGEDGSPVWRFLYGEKRTHPYFHPLSLPAGRVLTADGPADHVHHYGLWFSWKYINGVNFWEHAPGTDRPAGRTEWEVAEVRPREDLSARIVLSVRYVPARGEVALCERRVIEVSAPETGGGFVIDWSSRFVAAAEEVVLDRTPPPGEPGGQVWGGYAGLSARLVQMGERRASTLEGAAEFNAEDRFRGRSNGFDYSGVVDGEQVGIAILSDPANLNAPSPWYAIRSSAMTFFTPAVLCYQPHRLGRGEGFDLRYRVVVHPGRWGPEHLAAAFAAFTDELGADERTGDDSEESDQ